MNSLSRQLLAAFAILAANNPTASLARTDNSPDSVTIQTFEMGFLPWDLAFDGENIWTNDYFGTSVAKIRASDGVIVGTYYLEDSPRCLAFDGDSIWAGIVNGKLTKLRASDGTIETTVYLGPPNMGHILFDGQNIWVSSWDGQSTVFKVQPSDGTILGTYVVGRHPYGLAFDG